jgi:hypothetical protein
MSKTMQLKASIKNLASKYHVPTLAHVVALHLEFAHAVIAQVIRQDALISIFRNHHRLNQVIDLLFQNFGAQIGLVAIGQCTPHPPGPAVIPTAGRVGTAPSACALTYSSGRQSGSSKGDCCDR